MRIIRTMTIAAVFLSLASNAVAQDKPKALTVGDVIGVTAGLRSLKTYPAQDKTGAAIQLPYKFGATVLFDMATNIYRGDTVAKAYQEAINDMIRQVAAGGAQVPPDKMPEFSAQAAKLLESPAKVELIRIRRESLNSDAQPISPEVMAQILPILE